MSSHWGYQDASSLDRFAHIRELGKLLPYSFILAGYTGSHSWGLATDESDIDIRGLYVKPTREILALHKGRDTIEKQGEIDIQFYELEKAAKMILAHNGNIVELALSPTVFYLTKEGIQFRNIAKKFLTKRLANYYLGYATSQRKRAAQNRGGKALIYTLREGLAGVWLFREHHIEYDFRTLWKNVEEAGIFKSPFFRRVFERPKWHLIGDEEMYQFDREWEEIQLILKEEAAKSSLPDDYDGYDELNELLLSVRYERMDTGVDHGAKEGV